MRLFGYYAIHTLKNQIKKLFKTWVLIFFVICFVIGGLIGGGVAMLEDASGQDGTPPDISGAEDEVMPDEGELENGVEETEPPDLQTVMNIVELIAGGIVFAILIFSIFGADKNGSKIFLPADVNLLFASPMMPQSVLMFRLMTQVGVAIISFVYLTFQIPNLVINMGLSVWAAIGILAGFLLTVAVGQLLRVLVYILASSNYFVKKNLRNGIYLLILLVGGGYAVYTKISGLDWSEGAIGFFNSGVSRYIPIWGWLKGFAMFCLEGNIIGIVLSIIAILAGGALLAIIIWRIDADFYEDAMAKSEETAQLLEAAQSQNATGTVRRKKDRSQRIKRDGFNRGLGANVFFFRSLYNRFRFAHFKIFTKTSETYIFAAAAVSLLCRFVIKTDGLLPSALVIGGLAFWRTLGNPLEEDTSRDFFRLIPEKTYKKLFWSVLGGSINCLLDILLPILLTVLICGSKPIVALAFVPLILSVDFYGTNVGAFINLSVPVNAGKTIKQVVMVMFVYFGLLPDIAIIATGFVFGFKVLSLVIAASVNILLGLVFLCLSTVFLEPASKERRVCAQLDIKDRAKAKKAFSRVGLSCFVILAITTALQIALEIILGEQELDGWVFWLSSLVPMYAVAIPIGILILRTVPSHAPKRRQFGAKNTAISIFISVFFMYAGNFIGTLLNSLLPSSQGGVTNIIVGGGILQKIVFVVILAPIIEELVFRKLIIDRLRIYGEATAVLVSALIFGLFHGNIQQLCYTFLLGLVFGYIYQRTGKLRYSIGMHMGVNFVGGVLSAELLKLLEPLMNIDLNAEELVLKTSVIVGVIIFLVYILIMISSAVVGLVLFFVNKRRLVFNSAPMELPKKGRAAIIFLNVGMVLLVLACVAMTVLASI